MVDPSKMLRTGSGYTYSDPNAITNEQYRIAAGDIISFNLFTNEGEKIIDPTSVTGQTSIVNQASTITYTVDLDGTTKIPLIGKTMLQGLTQHEAEKMLEEKYTMFFNKPYIFLTITNKRVFVLKGGNTSSVVPLTNANTTLMEVLAQTGGVGDSKAHKIKLIRMKDQKPLVYLIDLSQIENINQGNIVMQANDIVYVTPRDRVPEEILKAITPYLTLLTTFLAIYGIFIK